MSPIFVKIILICCCLFIWLSVTLILSNIQKIKEELASDHTEHSGPLRQHGDFWVWHDFIRRTNDFRPNESITLTTHATYMDLGLLPLLLVRWQAPISLAIHVSGSDYERTMQSWDYLKNCLNLKQLLRRYVSIHLVFHQDHIPRKLNMRSSMLPSDGCREGAPYRGGRTELTYSFKHKLTHPVNLLRNVARSNAPTYFVLALDLELIPTAHFVPKFLDACYTEFRCNRLEPKVVFCLVTFPHLLYVPIPETKARLRQMLQDVNLSKPFYNELDLQRQWLTTPNPEGEITVFKKSNQMEMCVAYVSINEVEPPYDERYPLESIYDEDSSLKARVLVGLNYTFITLDGAFLIRRSESRWSRVLGHVEMPENEKLGLLKSWHYLYKNFVGPESFRFEKWSQNKSSIKNETIFMH